MKLATMREGGPDGRLVVVSRDLRRAVPADGIAPTLQAALDDWDRVRPRLEQLAASLEAGAAPGAGPFDPARAHSPLPRAFQWLDGSVYPAHMDRMSRWRGVPVPRGVCMYQGGSDGFLGPMDPIGAASEDWGIDFEAEVAVVTAAVPYGTKAADAGRHIALLMLCNDVSLRNLIPDELAKEFGFVQGKPASAFSPVAVTPDELGAAWNRCRLHLPLVSHVNGTRFGDPDAGAMEYGFDDLIAHAAVTRSLGAGTVIGSGTVSSPDIARGFSCISEQRVAEMLDGGEPRTPFLRWGDTVRIEMADASGASVFGAIDQRVAQPGA